MQSCFRLDNPVPTAAFTLSVWLAQGCPAMPSTACYYAANLGDNPRKLVTDTFIPVHGLQGLFFGFLFLGFGVFFVFLFLLLQLFQLPFCYPVNYGKKRSQFYQSLIWVQSEDEIKISTCPFTIAVPSFFFCPPLFGAPERKEGVLGQESFTSLLSIHHSFLA